MEGTGATRTGALAARSRGAAPRAGTVTTPMDGVGATGVGALAPRSVGAPPRDGAVAGAPVGAGRAPGVAGLGAARLGPSCLSGCRRRGRPQRGFLHRWGGAAGRWG
eukprot:TRINITY_DN13044_c0_g1_i1.p3 TRINITY_DN13044_c0_g1~~TRINITY_DN13044_c0_g1_i1.p3  ORF type:complete len:107 (-),score=1.22 TRINITY_DN13044_c0_g1_i1:151-471(-)